MDWDVLTSANVKVRLHAIAACKWVNWVVV